MEAKSYILLWISSSTDGERIRGALGEALGIRWISEVVSYTPLIDPQVNFYA